MALSWIQTVLFGVRQIFDNGALKIERGALNFIGLTVTDDPALKRTNVEAPSTALLAGATKNATPNTLALRGASAECNFGGTCNFATLAASVAITSPSITSSASCSAVTLAAVTSVTTPLILGAPTLLVQTPDTVVALASSSPLEARSGSALGTAGISGDFIVGSGAATQISGDATIYTGNASTGATGNVNLAVGLSASGAGGNVNLAGGAGATLYGSIGLGEGTPDFSGGGRVIWIAEATVNPASGPANGGVLFIDASDGSLRFFDRAGGETILAPEGGGLLLSASASITLTYVHLMLVATHAAPTITLPAGITGKEFNIKYKGSGSATIIPNGSEKIFDFAQQSTLVLNTGDAVELIFDGIDWSVA